MGLRWQRPGVRGAPRVLAPLWYWEAGAPTTSCCNQAVTALEYTFVAARFWWVRGAHVPALVPQRGAHHKRAAPTALLQKHARPGFLFCGSPQGASMRGPHPGAASGPGSTGRRRSWAMPRSHAGALVSRGLREYGMWGGRAPRAPHLCKLVVAALPRMQYSVPACC